MSGSILDRFRRGNKTVIMATHSMKLAQKSCTRVIWLDRGVIRSEGDPAEVCAAYAEECGK